MAKTGKDAAAGSEPDLIDETPEIDEDSPVIARLAEIAENAPLDLKTLTADLRDATLELFKHRPKPWQQMTEAEQRATARMVEAAATATISRAVALLAADGRPSIEARLEKFAGKGGKFQITLMAMGGPELAADLARLDGHHVMVASADAEPYRGQRPAQIDPDESALEFDEDPPAMPAHDSETGELIDGQGDEELAGVEEAAE